MYSSFEPSGAIPGSKATTIATTCGTVARTPESVRSK